MARERATLVRTEFFLLRLFRSDRARFDATKSVARDVQLTIRVTGDQAVRVATEHLCSVRSFDKHSRGGVARAIKEVPIELHERQYYGLKNVC